MTVDVLFVSPGNSKAIYQGLAHDFSAIEPPTWALLLAQSVRAVGFEAAILDVNAERLGLDQVVNRVVRLKPRLICLVVYGQNPNSGTVNMSGAVQISEKLKSHDDRLIIGVIGSHASALPREVLVTEPSIDIVFCNEGVYSLRNVLRADLHDVSQLIDVKGLALRAEGKVMLTVPEVIVPQERMDEDLPGYAWDLLPYKEKPLDLYRSHFWHASYLHEKRTPFVAIYTSLGCTFQCDFCMINILNRDNTDEVGVASDFPKMRFWSPELIISEFDKLVEMGVETLRISDEMFLLNKRYYSPLCEMLRDRGYGEKLNMWAYSRIDTVRDMSQLKLVREAGIRWLALGIESGDEAIRKRATKGRFQDLDIRSVINNIEESGIEVIANYLFGLPGDGFESMNRTLQLSLELCTTAWNGYPAMALPGSQLYKEARKKGYELPATYAGYSFLGYDTVPLPTDHLTPAQVLEFRDHAFVTYHSAPRFQEKVRRRFGSKALENINKMLEVKIQRRLLQN